MFNFFWANRKTILESQEKNAIENGYIVLLKPTYKAKNGKIKKATEINGKWYALSNDMN
jgi:hypothetical protein